MYITFLNGIVVINTVIYLRVLLLPVNNCCYHNDRTHKNNRLAQNLLFYRRNL